MINDLPPNQAYENAGCIPPVKKVAKKSDFQNGNGFLSTCVYFAATNRLITRSKSSGPLQ